MAIGVFCVQAEVYPGHQHIFYNSLFGCIGKFIFLFLSRVAKHKTSHKIQFSINFEQASAFMSDSFLHLQIIM